MAAPTNVSPPLPFRSLPRTPSKTPPYQNPLYKNLPSNTPLLSSLYQHKEKERINKINREKKYIDTHTYYIHTYIWYCPLGGASEPQLSSPFVGIKSLKSPENPNPFLGYIFPLTFPVSNPKLVKHISLRTKHFSMITKYVQSLM